MAKKQVVIIGAGCLARETYGWVSDQIADGAPWRIKGFLDERTDALGAYNIPEGVLGSVESYKICSEDVFVSGIGKPEDKKSTVERILTRGGQFVSVIHPLAKIGRNIKLGVGLVLAPFAVMDCDLSVGNFVTVLHFSTFGHDSRIGDWCQVSSHCAINGSASLGRGVFLGSHACIIPGIQVGEWAYVGAGSVVIKRVEPHTKVFGNPARPFASPE